MKLTFSTQTSSFIVICFSLLVPPLGLRGTRELQNGRVLGKARTTSKISEVRLMFIFIFEGWNVKRLLEVLEQLKHGCLEMVFRLIELERREESRERGFKSKGKIGKTRWKQKRASWTGTSRIVGNGHRTSIQPSLVLVNMFLIIELCWSSVGSRSSLPKVLQQSVHSHFETLSIKCEVWQLRGIGRRRSLSFEWKVNSEVVRVWKRKHTYGGRCQRFSAVPRLCRAEIQDYTDTVKLLVILFHSQRPCEI